MNNKVGNNFAKRVKLSPQNMQVGVIYVKAYNTIVILIEIN